MTLMSAVLATFSAISPMHMGRFNADSDATIEANLLRLKNEYLDRVRSAAIKGSEAAVRAFATLVQDQVSSGSRAWVLIHDIAAPPDLELLQKLPVVEKGAAAKLAIS
jgi:hypothetical protein